MNICSGGIRRNAITFGICSAGLSLFELRRGHDQLPQAPRLTVNADRLGRCGSACDPIVEIHKADDELDPERFGDLVEGRQAGGHVASLEARDGRLGRAETLR